MPRGSIAKKSWDSATGLLRFDWSGGGSNGIPTFTEYNVNDLPANIRADGLMHGINQKLGDEYAGESDVMDAVILVGDMWEQLKSGTWSTKGAGTGPRPTLLARAMVRSANCSLEHAIKVLRGYTREQRAALKAMPQVAKAYSDIEAEDAKARSKALAPAAKEAKSNALFEMFVPVAGSK